MLFCTGTAEVKTRTGKYLAFPEEAVTKKKQHNLIDAATCFMDTSPQYRNLRYDIISILFQDGFLQEVVHFEEAFH
jgi:Holliday junction resolvase-like predicted endonuclease